MTNKKVLFLKQICGILVIKILKCKISDFLNSNTCFCFLLFGKYNVDCQYCENYNLPSTLYMRPVYANKDTQLVNWLKYGQKQSWIRPKMICNIMFVILTCFYLANCFGEEKFNALPSKNKVPDKNAGPKWQIFNFHQPFRF